MNFTRTWRDQHGQGFTEVAALMPVFVVGAVAMAFVISLEWRGVKNQEAANAAAQIYGQQHFPVDSQDSFIFDIRINMHSSDQILCNNFWNSQGNIPAKFGTFTHMENGYVDWDTLTTWATDTLWAADNNTVYGNMIGAVRDTFNSPSIRAYIPAPQISNATTGSAWAGSPAPFMGQPTICVNVAQFLQLPNMPLFGATTIKGMAFNDTAYGGSDTAIYGLMRRAPPTGGQLKDSFWIKAVKSRAKYLNVYANPT